MQSNYSTILHIWQIQLSLLWMIYAMNNIKIIFVWIVSVLFVRKEVRCANKTEIKDGLQYAIKKSSLPGDMIIYTTEDLVMN